MGYMEGVQGVHSDRKTLTCCLSGLRLQSVIVTFPMGFHVGVDLLVGQFIDHPVGFINWKAS